MENNYISVEELVDEYNKQNTKDSKASYLKKALNIKKYLSYKLKMSLANNIVQSTSYAIKASNDTNEKVEYLRTNRIEINSNYRSILFCCAILSNYTNIKIDMAKFIEEYDMLKELNLIDAIIDMIPKEEINECEIVLQRTYDDFMVNNYETHAFISNQVQRVVDTLNVVLEPIVEKLASMTDSDIEKYGNKIIKFMNENAK